MRLSTPEAFGSEITSGFFGGNFLANRDQIGDAGTTDELIAELGVTSLRYPGGSLTENYFDISNPDRDMVVTTDGDTTHFVPMSDFLAYAADNDLPVTIVLPTKTSMGSTVDSNGNRFPDIDETTLRNFVHDVATGVYGDAEIQAFEIGNEYWGSGEMTAVEYGRLSSQMAEIIDDELQAVETLTGEDPGIEIVVQAGTNHGYSNLSSDYSGFTTAEDIIDDLNDKYGMNLGLEIKSGPSNVNWRVVNDQLLINEFDSGELAAVDAVNTHIYSQSQAVPGHRDYALDQVERSWTEVAPNIDIWVTEWNSSASSPALQQETDFGLHQAHEMLNILETMADSGVDQAHVWPLLQNTKNALSVGSTHSELSPPGEMFAMMVESLPGKTMLDFVPGDDNTTEASTSYADFHAFYGDGEVVMYIASNTTSVDTTVLDLTNMIAAGGDVSAQVLGVAPGDSPGDTRSTAQIDELDAEDFYADGFVTAVLDHGEIMEVTIRDFVPTDDFAHVMDEIDTGGSSSSGGSGGFDFPTVPVEEDDPWEDEEEDYDFDDDGGGGGGGGAMFAMLGLIPILLVVGGLAAF